ncbi:hypothetical protein KQY27_02345 [Methanobrevibacter sp. TMH8]|uniref:hypothetical protein n=1 Tax=Methanobrevibacter sp. TMH8 TaxID=2848611 RepID=UPI001CCEEE8B|nr:hypothetical protein [Methanobrevibacter sp. TMH8]MBZ9570384.1 hypothetical protein [Methanobrevibacter sp. TMH8]
MPTQRLIKLFKKDALVRGIRGKTYKAIIQEGINIPENPNTCYVEFINKTPVISHFDDIKDIQKVSLEKNISGITTLEMFS